MHKQTLLRPIVGHVMHDRPFEPVLLICAGAYVKFYHLHILKDQGYEDAMLSFNRKGHAPDWAGARGFIVRHGREVLGYRHETEDTFHPLV